MSSTLDTIDFDKAERIFSLYERWDRTVSDTTKKVERNSLESEKKNLEYFLENILPLLEYNTKPI